MLRCSGEGCEFAPQSGRNFHSFTLPERESPTVKSWILPWNKQNITHLWSVRLYTQAGRKRQIYVLFMQVSFVLQIVWYKSIFTGVSLRCSFWFSTAPFSTFVLLLCDQHQIITEAFETACLKCNLSGSQVSFSNWLYCLVSVIGPFEHPVVTLYATVQIHTMKGKQKKPTSTPTWDKIIHALSHVENCMRYIILHLHE